MPGGITKKFFACVCATSLLAAGCTSQWTKPEPTQDAPVAATTVEASTVVDDIAAAAPPPANSSPTVDPAAAENLWIAVARELATVDTRNPAVSKELKWYANNRKCIQTSSTNARPYLYFVVQEIKQRRLPIELALLPILESGFKPEVRSPNGAAGLWQFMQDTGAKLGLKRTKWYDGRRDVTASTGAALDYLQTLNQRFDGDWQLTIAAYNAGWGNLEQAIATNRTRGKPTDIWSLPVRAETRQLVARWLALSDIIKQPAQYGVDLEPIPNIPYFATVELTKPTDLRRLAQQARVHEQAFKELNPGFTTWHSGPTAAAVLVPTAQREHAVQAAATLAPAPIDPSLIAEAETQTARTGKSSKPAVLYTVKTGDSLWLIARRHNLRVTDITALNKISKKGLSPGQQLRLPGPPVKVAAAPAPATPPGSTVKYRVQKGDSLWTISRQFNVSIEQLLAWNNLDDSHDLHPGQKILVSRPRT